MQCVGVRAMGSFAAGWAEGRLLTQPHTTRYDFRGGGDAATDAVYRSLMGGTERPYVMDTMCVKQDTKHTIQSTNLIGTPPPTIQQ